MSTDFDEKPPPPPLRFTSSTSQPQAFVDLKHKPLPREPESDVHHHNSYYSNFGGKKKDKHKDKKSSSFSKLKLNKSSDKDRVSEKPVISLPSNFEHTVHVGYDHSTGEFTGMPDQWLNLLKTSQITKLEQQQNPQGVLDALNFYTGDSLAHKQKFLQMRNQSDSATPFGHSFISESPRDSYTPSSSPAVFPPQYAPPKPPEEESSDEDERPPPIPDRPARTLSIIASEGVAVGSVYTCGCVAVDRLTGKSFHSDRATRVHRAHRYAFTGDLQQRLSLILI